MAFGALFGSGAGSGMGRSTRSPAQTSRGALAQLAQSWEVNPRAPERVVRDQVTDLVIFVCVSVWNA